MKQLVTGGAGFIGSNYILYIIEKFPDYEIICLDALTYAGNLSTLKAAFKSTNFRFIKGDITDKEFIFDLFSVEKIDVVVNFAAESHVDRSIEDSSIFLKTNIIGTQILMDAARKYGVKRFHQVSTDEVYGDLPLERKDLLFTEGSQIKTSSPYAASKAAADLLVEAYYKTFDFPITISRCSNNYGPFQFPEKLIPLMIVNALEEKELPIYGKGENVRDWIYVLDHCIAIDMIIHKGKIGETYNIGGHNEKTNLEVVMAIINELDKSIDLIKYVSDRLGHDKRYAIDAQKIKNSLGWEPTIPFEKGIKMTIKWYLDNKIWLDEIISCEYKDYYEKMYGGR